MRGRRRGGTDGWIFIVPVPPVEFTFKWQVTEDSSPRAARGTGSGAGSSGAGREGEESAAATAHRPGGLIQTPSPYGNAGRGRGGRLR